MQTPKHFIHLYAYIYIYIYTYICTYIYIYTQMYKYIYMHTYIYIYIYMTMIYLFFISLCSPKPPYRFMTHLIALIPQQDHQDDPTISLWTSPSLSSSPTNGSSKTDCHLKRVAIVSGRVCMQDGSILAILKDGNTVIVGKVRAWWTENWPA